MAMSSVRDVVLVAVTVASCSTPKAEVPRVRFANAPPVTIVDDRRHVAQRPEPSPTMLDLDFYDRSFADPIFRELSLPQKQRARGVNALDEVPDSTWFTNRIGARTMTPEEIAHGPEADDGPELHKPWTVISTKSGGTEVGFIMRDARGVKYGLGFDAPEWPELETGTHAVVNRLLWAFGYNVPDDRVVYVKPEEILVAPDAVTKDSQGRTLRRLRRKEVDRLLGTVARTSDGRIRVLASRWLSGESLGGTPPDGVRRGDPNDRIPHQDRRDLRGAYPLFAWVEHTDLVQANFLDMLITPPHDHARRYVVHYMIDFGKSMGVMAVSDHNLRVSHRYLFDWSEPAWNLGLTPRPWGHKWAPRLTGVSPTFVAAFDPAAWRPNLPYRPFEAADRFDMFWGAKTLARFTREQVHAAVEAGRFSDPRTVEYITETLVARQRTMLAYSYARVNPLDRFTVTPSGLCFEDLAIAARLAFPALTRYDVASFDRNGQPIGRIRIDAAPGGGPTCASSMKVALGGDSYTIVKITTVRRGFAGSTDVHLARDPTTGQMRVIGVWRI
jgi:hypothetical protein